MSLVDWLTTELGLSHEQAIASVTQAFRKGKSLQGIIEHLIEYPLPLDLNFRLKELQRFEWGIRYGLDVFTPGIEENLADQILYLIENLVPMRLCQLHRIIPISMATYSPIPGRLYHYIVRVAMVNPDDIQAEDDLGYQLRRRGYELQRLAILPEDYERLFRMCTNEQTLREHRQALQRAYEANLKLKEERKALQKAYEIETRIVHSQPKELVDRLRRLQRFELKILYGLLCVNLDWKDESSDQIFDLIETLIPLRVCQDYQVIPIARLRNSLSSIVQVAMVDPNNLHAQNMIEICLKPHKLALQRFVIPINDFRQAIDAYVERQNLKRQGDL